MTHHSRTVIVFSSSKAITTPPCQLCGGSSRSSSSSWSPRECSGAGPSPAASASCVTTTTTTTTGFRNAAAAAAAGFSGRGASDLPLKCHRHHHHPGQEICGRLGRWAGVTRIDSCSSRRRRRRSSTSCVELFYFVPTSNSLSAKPHSSSSSSSSSPSVQNSSPSSSFSPSSFRSGLGRGLQLERRRSRPFCRLTAARAGPCPCPCPCPGPSRAPSRAPNRVVVVRVSTSPAATAQTETEAETDSRHAAAANYGSEASLGGGLGEKAKKEEKEEKVKEGEEGGVDRYQHHQHVARAVQLPPGLRAELMPRHVAIIMDGNARWAERRGLHRSVGHVAGAEALKEVARAASNWGIDALTVFAFSTENWRRPQAEVDYLMRMFETKLRTEMGNFIMRHKFRLRFIGDASSLPRSLQKAGEWAMDITRGNTGMIINLCVSYSGRADLVQACQKLAAQVAEGTLDPADIDEAAIGEKVSLNELGELKYPDLLIRTSGEQRISNFLLWQVAYTELVFSDALWPDFGKEEFRAALVAYQQRDRRYGIRED